MKNQWSSLAGQRGNFVVGLIVGLLLGLVLALGVALYVTKAPIPFVNKVQQRTPEQDAAEAQRNRNWDPNAALAGKNPAPGLGSHASAPGTAVPGSGAPTTGTGTTTRDPAAILTGKPVPSAAPSSAGVATAGASAPAVATKPGADPFTYFVQAGAYARTEEAEQQRARLAMMGFAAKVTEREQSGRTVYRVRLGPFDKKEEADSTKERLEGGGVEAALVRVQR